MVVLHWRLVWHHLSYTGVPKLYLICWYFLSQIQISQLQQKIRSKGWCLNFERHDFSEIDGYWKDDINSIQQLPLQDSCSSVFAPKIKQPQHMVRMGPFQYGRKLYMIFWIPGYMTQVREWDGVASIWCGVVHCSYVWCGVVARRRSGNAFHILDTWINVTSAVRWCGKHVAESRRRGKGISFPCWVTQAGANRAITALLHVEMSTESAMYEGITGRVSVGWNPIRWEW